MIIVLFILLILITLSILNVMRYGKGVIRPNFERVDRILWEKNTLAIKMLPWNSTLGKIVYYTVLISSIFIISSIIYIFIMK